MSEIWGIILAAGESKRMGTSKMLLPFKGKTIIENVIGTVVMSGVDKTIVVLGSGSNEIQQIIGRLPVKCCYNENYKQGMLSSVKCGFKNLPERFDAALIFLGDQPMVEISVINNVIDAYRNSGKGILMPVSLNKRGHPLMIDSKYRNEIESLDQGEGLRSLAQKFSDDVLEVEVNTSSILKDIDTMDDYNNELKQIR
ncbi:MAG: nucleotidyltransferase family protein [Bacteroidales bacterium]|jgi:molybdenum cofactor cytidylyltransferase|nr:nucleotidyltransferase family protein [Bacteroidales bacterium]